VAKKQRERLFKHPMDGDPAPIDRGVGRLRRKRAMAPTTTILVVDDDAQIQRLLKPSLAAAGYKSVPATSGSEALKLIATRAPDAIVLDLGLPDMDGKDVIRKVRGWSKVPIIMLSTRRFEAEEIAALDIGADDYIGKPFGVGGLIARIRNLLRHRIDSEGKTAVFSSGGLVIDTLAQSVMRDGKPIRLTVREFELLHLLVRHAGYIVTHRQILQAVWGSMNLDNTQYVRVFAGRLRKKIEADPSNPCLLTSERGVGYRFGPPR
jgi:two-component system KDP operon response regulator KdpE